MYSTDFGMQIRPAKLLSSVAALLLGCLASLAPVVIAAGGLGFSGNAQALACGTYDSQNKLCNGTAYQYGGGFNPQVGESGGFGGAYSCVVSRTPVIFVHGNADNATSWDGPTSQVSGYAKPPRSVYQELKAAGYKDCELFGVTYLTASERGAPQLNYHHSSKYAILQRFINQVKSYTGRSQVDLVTHSMGVSMSMAALTYYGTWGSVRRFVNIAGGLQGLDSCRSVGYSNPYVTTCGSQNWYWPEVFGFYPNDGGINPWTGTTASKALRNSAASNPAVSFYTIHAGDRDQVMCTVASYRPNCGKSPLFPAAANVKGQYMVGTGSTAWAVDWSWQDGMPYNAHGGDLDGVGHLRARANAGAIIVKMLTTTCTTGCDSGYKNIYGPTQVQ